MRSTGAPPGLRVSSSGGTQFPPVEVMVCCTCAWSNSHRTVDPVETVTSSGSYAGPPESTASMTVVWPCAAAALAVRAQATTAATSAKQSFDSDDI